MTTEEKIAQVLINYDTFKTSYSHSIESIQEIIRAEKIKMLEEKVAKIIESYSRVNAKLQIQDLISELREEGKENV